MYPRSLPCVLRVGRGDLEFQDLVGQDDPSGGVEAAGSKNAKSGLGGAEGRLAEDGEGEGQSARQEDPPMRVPFKVCEA